jgi:prepilin-type processing-associated H-X9-DG protein
VEGVTCYNCFGQSYAYNNSAYTASDSPYDKGEVVRFQEVEEKGDKVIMLTDFSPVWHGVMSKDKSSSKYYLNILFFDGHVDGKEFSSDEEVEIYRDRHSRWWE